MSGPQGGGGQFNFTCGIEAHTDHVVWTLQTLRARAQASSTSPGNRKTPMPNTAAMPI